MNWLQDNQFGRALVYVCGVLLLLVIIMAIVWSLPVSDDTSKAEAEVDEAADTVLVAREIVGINELDVINQKPLFNESRLPEIDEPDEESEVVEDTTVAVKDAPDMKLTGVIITPGMKIATLTPSNASLENVMAYEGDALVGEYLGWKVADVKPRTVTLVSNDGQQLKLELQVHEAAIKEPPKPVVAAAAPSELTAQDAAEQAAPAAGESEQPLSRAEQIRQRIAERREELRRQQEQIYGKEPQGGGRTSYQNAIRNMMQNKSKDQGSDDNNDG